MSEPIDPLIPVRPEAAGAVDASPLVVAGSLRALTDFDPRSTEPWRYRRRAVEMLSLIDPTAQKPLCTGTVIFMKIMS